MIGGQGKFDEDLKLLVARLSADMPQDARAKLDKLKKDLSEMHRVNVVKINHSVMELVCAKYLIMKGFEVELEYPLDAVLTCDVYSTKGYGNLIVEIETGYIPPEHAMDPLTYTAARLASKIVRYSSFAGKFAIGVPPHYVLPLPASLSLPPRRRTQQDIERLKALCDRFYQQPPVTEDCIRNARIQEIYVIDVDRLRVEEMDPEAYMRRALNKGVVFSAEDETLLEEQVHPKQTRQEEKIDFYMK